MLCLFMWSRALRIEGNSRECVRLWSKFILSWCIVASDSGEISLHAMIWSARIVAVILENNLTCMFVISILIPNDFQYQNPLLPFM